MACFECSLLSQHVGLPRTIDEIMGPAPKSKRAHRLKPTATTHVGGKDA
jgi:hypothetical protein